MTNKSWVSVRLFEKFCFTLHIMNITVREDLCKNAASRADPSTFRLNGVLAYTRHPSRAVWGRRMKAYELTARTKPDFSRKTDVVNVGKNYSQVLILFFE
jgi:hypothetical protein